MAISAQFPFDFEIFFLLKAIQTVVEGFHILSISIMEVRAHFFKVPEIVVNYYMAFNSHRKLVPKVKDKRFIHIRDTNTG